MPEDADTPKILYCRCAYAGIIQDEVKDAVLKGLCASGRNFECVSDLCELSARQDPSLKAIAEAGPLKIAACHPRAVKWLFHSAKADFVEESEVHIANMRDESAETVLKEILQ